MVCEAECIFKAIFKQGLLNMISSYTTFWRECFLISKALHVYTSWSCHRLKQSFDMTFFIKVINGANTANNLLHRQIMFTSLEQWNFLILLTFIFLAGEKKSNQGNLKFLNISKS